MLCLISALGSHSRGALLAMATMGLFLWWRSKSKVMLGVVILIMLAVALAFMPEGWTERMNTIGTYEEDVSAMGRINAWTMAINIANDRVLGAGFVAGPAGDLPGLCSESGFRHRGAQYLLPDSGRTQATPGCYIYLLFWFTTFRMAGRIVRLTSGRDDLQWAFLLATMSKVSLLSFAVGGAFLSLAYWDMPYYLMVILLCTERLVVDTLATPQPVVSEPTSPGDTLENTGTGKHHEWVPATQHTTGKV